MITLAIFSTIGATILAYWLWTRRSSRRLLAASSPRPDTNLYYVVTQAIAKQCQAVVDANDGYPKQGTHVGLGPWDDNPPFTTLTYYAPSQIAGQWVYLADAHTTAVLAPSVATLGLPAPVVGSSIKPVIA